MSKDARVYSLPNWRLTRWLADPGSDVPPSIRLALIEALFGSLPVFAGGVINTLMVSGVIALRQPTTPFLIWFGLEVTICLARLFVLIVSRKAALEGRKTATDIYLLLAVAWSASVGYGVLISMMAADWVAATLACLSAAAMVGGICFRNFSSPRLAAAMILFSLGPCVPGAIIAGEPLLYVVVVQIPLYLVTMSTTAFRLNEMLIKIMRAERDNEHRARHDALTGLSNRTGLEDAFDAKVRASRANGSLAAVLFLDLDGFKAVNDTYGHGAGDRLLKHVGDRLRSAVRAGDIVSRIGGDEFVILAETRSAEQAMELGERLIQTVAASYDLGYGVNTRVGASAGIAMLPEHGSDLDALLTVADAALYEAKSSGKSRHRMGTLQTNVTALHRLNTAGGQKTPSAAA